MLILINFLVIFKNRFWNVYSLRVKLNETFNNISEPLEWKPFALVFINELILLRVDDICLGCLILYFWNPLYLHPLFFFNWVLLLIIVSLFFISFCHFILLQLVLKFWILLLILHNFQPVLFLLPFKKLWLVSALFEPFFFQLVFQRIHFFFVNFLRWI